MSADEQIARFLKQQGGSTASAHAAALHLLSTGASSTPGTFVSADAQIQRYAKGEPAAAASRTVAAAASVNSTALPAPPPQHKHEAAAYAVLPPFKRTAVEGTLNLPDTSVGRTLASLVADVLMINVATKYGGSSNDDISYESQGGSVRGLYAAVKAMSPSHPMLGNTAEAKALVTQWCGMAELLSADKYFQNLPILQDLNHALSYSQGVAGHGLTLADYHLAITLLPFFAVTEYARLQHLHRVYRLVDFVQRTPTLTLSTRLRLPLNGVQVHLQKT